jgi:hypothetical protein
MITARVELSEPWEWDPPIVDVEIAEAASTSWPMPCRIIRASPAGRLVPGCGPHPYLPDGPEVLVDRPAELALRHRYDVAPGLDASPTVYVIVKAPMRFLVGYGAVVVAPRTSPE